MPLIMGAFLDGKLSIVETEYTPFFVVLFFKIIEKLNNIKN